MSNKCFSDFLDSQTDTHFTPETLWSTRNTVFIILHLRARFSQAHVFRLLLLLESGHINRRTLSKRKKMCACVEMNIDQNLLSGGLYKMQIEAWHKQTQFSICPPLFSTTIGHAHTLSKRQRLLLFSYTQNNFAFCNWPKSQEKLLIARPIHNKNTKR